MLSSIHPRIGSRILLQNLITTRLLPSFEPPNHQGSLVHCYKTRIIKPLFPNFSTQVMSTSKPHIDFAPNVKLNNGTEIPSVGFGLGTAHFKSDPNAPEDKQLVNIVTTAIKTGFHHLDGAEIYKNEKELGDAIAQSKLPRDQLFITTKISGFGTGITDAKASFELSLKKLGLDYVNLYLIHAPYFAKSESELQQTWADLENIYASGKAKAIGVSNFLQKDIEILLKTAKVIPAVNQIEYHPYLQHGNLLPFLKKHGIVTSAYAPLTAVLRAKPGPLDDTYDRLAKKYEVTPGDIALRWIIDQGFVAITTTGKEERLKEYQKISQFKLTEDEIQTISEIGKKKNFRGFMKDKFAEDDWS